MRKNQHLRHIHLNGSIFVLIYSATILLTQLTHSSLIQNHTFNEVFPLLFGIGIALSIGVLIIEIYLASLCKVFKRCEVMGFYFNIIGLLMLLLLLIIRNF